MNAVGEAGRLGNTLTTVKGIGEARAKLLQTELNIRTAEDLLFHFPLRYLDKSSVTKISEIGQSANLHVLLAGTITDVTEAGTGKANRITAMLNDGSGSIELIWFRGLKWIRDVIYPSARLMVFGKPSVFNNRFTISHPEIEPLTMGEQPGDGQGIQPVYSLTEPLKQRGVNGKVLAKAVGAILREVKSEIHEILPPALLARYRLMGRYAALQNIHFPLDSAHLQGAQRRLKFEELFLMQARLVRAKMERRVIVNGLNLSEIGPLFKAFYHEHLNFQLTEAQKRVLREIRADVKGGHQMSRLVQGDVGSGKTIVAFMAMLMALDNGYQACMLAPTEILAQQHYQNLVKMTQPMGIKVRLLTGSTGKRARKSLDAEFSDGLQILVGTHALLENWVQLPRLGLVVIDEQHRFGVAQRARMWHRADSPPHVLIMTATPIPRTLAMTAYGDLEISVIDEMPPGRVPIITRHVPIEHRDRLYAFMKKEMDAGRQIYVVYPLIEESAEATLQDLTTGSDELARVFPPPQYRMGILHGRMKGEEKEAEMQRFKSHQTDLLVSTTVIEVGVDVPNATIMVIMNAERFGLSQLHQLRGRVGRGTHQSYCLLVTKDAISGDARERIGALVRSNDGFKIAETDLQLRGPGDMMGTRQSGELTMKIADLILDQPILTEARKAAEELMQKDFALELPEHRALGNYLNRTLGGHIDWSLVG